MMDESNEEEEKPFRCNLCWSSFTTRSHLIAHNKYKHQDGAYVCRFCSEVFKQNQTLSRHFRLIHNAELRIPHQDVSVQTGWEYGENGNWICLELNKTGAICGQTYSFNDFDSYDVHTQDHRSIKKVEGLATSKFSIVLELV